MYLKVLKAGKMETMNLFRNTYTKSLQVLGSYGYFCHIHEPTWLHEAVRARAKLASFQCLNLRE